MKALSIRQPWAELIIVGLKDIENRTWKTDFRGRIYVHASKQLDFSAMSVLGPLVGGRILQRGAIIGEVDIIDCVTNHGSEWFEGPFGLVLANPCAYIEPILYRGQLGLFEVQLDPEKVRAARGN